jgi:hypothetical protein
LTDISYPVFQFEADFENIELAEILKLTDLESLSGQAKLAGNASLRYDLKEGFDGSGRAALCFEVGLFNTNLK